MRESVLFINSGKFEITSQSESFIVEIDGMEWRVEVRLAHCYFTNLRNFIKRKTP